MQPEKSVIMCSLERLKVDLKGMKEAVMTSEYDLGDEFFGALDGSQLEHGALHVSVSIRKMTGFFELQFHTEGAVTVSCDRCLDDMSLDIENTGELKVKLGPDFADDGDIVVVPEDKGIVNVSWYIYEFIALAIPIKHVHAPGKCNKGMMEKLDEHTAAEGEDGEPEVDTGATDPRWDALNSLMESDNE